MKCACCLRQIREAYYTQAGNTYGPTCGKRLGLDIACKSLDMKNWNKPVTYHKPKLSNTIQKKIVVQNGQEELFGEVA